MIRFAENPNHAHARSDKASQLAHHAGSTSDDRHTHHTTARQPTQQAPMPGVPPQSKSPEASLSKTEQIAADLALVRRIQTEPGDEAFLAFYRTHAPRILRRILRMTGNQERAKDILQQVFIEALEGLPRYSGKGTLQGWLQRIASTTMLDQFRRERRWEQMLGHIRWGYSNKTQATDALPEKLFFSDECKALLHEALSRLGAQKRMAVLLCDMEGLSLEEAAIHIGIPLGTVGSRLHHGRRELKQMLTRTIQKQGLSIEDWLHV